MHISRETVHIVIAEESVIISSGTVAALDRLHNINAHIIEVTSAEALDDCMRVHSPDILIVNPLFNGNFPLQAMQNMYPKVKYIALAASYIPESVLNEYSASISIFDSIDKMGALFEKLLLEGSGAGDQSVSDTLYPYKNRDIDVPEVLSQREKEIVVCVVRGLTNKEIADELFLSIHTVIAHRRNISRKLQIHSVAGLTIYAIANKLIELDDLR